MPQAMRQVGTKRRHDASTEAPGSQAWYARWLRRLALRMTIDAAQMRPSTVNGTSLAVAPDSPCERTSS